MSPTRKTNISLSLNNEQELILLCLFGARFLDDSLTIKELEKLYASMYFALERNYGRYAEIVTGKLGIMSKVFGDILHDYERNDFEKNVNTLESLGLIKVIDLKKIRISEEGINVASRIEDGRQITSRPAADLRSTIFIACAFGHDAINALYTSEFVPACQVLGYEPIRVDLDEPSQTITQLILQGITESACVIADLTHARPSVYFEVGFANGLGIPLLLTCRSDHLKGKLDNARVHFDLAQYKISFWSVVRKKFNWQKGMSPLERLNSIVPSRVDDR